MTDEPKPERVSSIKCWEHEIREPSCETCRSEVLRAAPQEPAAALEGEVTGADRKAALDLFYSDWKEQFGNVVYGWMREVEASVLRGDDDEHYRIQAFKNHRLAALRPTASASEGEVDQAAKAICRTMPGPECFGACRACLKSAHAALSARLATPDTTAALREALHEIDVEVFNTIPPDGDQAAWAALKRIREIIDPFRMPRAALATSQTKEAGGE